MEESLILKKLELFFKIFVNLIEVPFNHQTKLKIILEATNISEVGFFFHFSKKFDTVNHES